MDDKSIKFLKKNLTIDNALSSIVQLEDNADMQTTDSLVKWKSYSHQVVVESGLHFYKIYEVTKNTPMMFDHIVRLAVAQVMQEIGVDWKLVTFDRGCDVFDFEQREKLQVTTRKDGEFKYILVSMSNIYSRVHEILEFDSILKQLHRFPEFERVKALQLTRSSVNKFDDYALFDDQVILLDDADFYISLLDESSHVLDVPYFKDIPVTTSAGDFVFKKYRAHSTKMRKGEERDDAEQVFHGWIFLPQSEDAVCEGEQPQDIKATSIVTNSNHLVQESDSSVAFQVKISAYDESDEHKDDVTREGVENDCIVLKSTLSDAMENDLYEKLEKLNSASAKVLLETELNPKCVKRTHDNLVVWESHMKAIGAYFPEVSKQTMIFLTNDFCKSYVEGDFNVGNFAGRFDTSIHFLPANVPDAFPSRKAYRKFVLKFLKGEPKMTFLFSRCFCELNDNQRGETNQFCDKRHSVIYNAYCDCNGCMLCDCINVSDALS